MTTVEEVNSDKTKVPDEFIFRSNNFSLLTLTFSNVVGTGMEWKGLLNSAMNRKYDK